MDFRLNSELMIKQRTIANSREPAELLELLAPTHSHHMFPEDLDVEKWPLPVRMKFKEKGKKDLETMSCVPNEVMDMIVGKLDLPSALSLSYVNRTANVLIQKSPVPFLKQWAPKLPRILKESYIQSEWTISQLKDVIRCGNCVSCGETCDHIFLATMERVCQPCIQYNHAYWCLPFNKAVLIFGLGPKEIAKIKPIYVPGLSITSGLTDPSAWVVPTKTVLAVGLQLHGSRKGIKHAAEGSRTPEEDKNSGNPDGKDDFVVKSQWDFYRAASLDPSTPAELRTPLILRHLHIQVHSRGISLRAFVVPQGNTRKIIRSCRGCAAMLTHPNLELITNQQMEMMRLDPDLNKYERGVVLFRRAFRVWTAAEMIEHIRSECLGGWSLMNIERPNWK
ncbi:hypothetical protein N7475_010363 [Penicillium sp. IBT 31633x]|nr:hypothetical protein N7475_010363 [Penicillium sp. IBT 31633x]